MHEGGPWAAFACAGEDLNLHGLKRPLGPQPSASTNSATSARDDSLAALTETLGVDDDSGIRRVENRAGGTSRLAQSSEQVEQDERVDPEHTRDEDRQASEVSLDDVRAPLRMRREP